MSVFIDYLLKKEWYLADLIVLNVKNKLIGMIISQFYPIYSSKENAGNVRKKFHFNIHL
jgi:hypothetical protein